MTVSVSMIKKRTHEIFQENGGKHRLVLLYLAATILVSLLTFIITVVVVGLLALVHLIPLSIIWFFFVTIAGSSVLYYGSINAIKAIRHQVPFSLSTYFRFENFKKVFSVTVLEGIFIFLWSLLLVVPGIIKSYAYSFTYYIIDDDPSVSVTEAITKSRQLMNGHKLTLFKYDLVYTLWYVALNVVVQVVTSSGVLDQSSQLLLLMLGLNFVADAFYWLKCIPMMWMGRYELYTRLRDEN